MGKTVESEQKVYSDSKREVLKNKGLTIVDFNFKDVDRFRTFYQIAHDAGKKMVISFKHACFLDQYHSVKSLDVPDSKGENIYLFKPKRMTGTYSDEDYSDKCIKKRLDYPNIVVAKDIQREPDKYMIVLNFWYFNVLADLRPENSLYIHSLSEPFNEEMEISFERMQNWLDYFNIRYVQAHCSGHMNGFDLRELINRIRPKTLFPIHTEYPNMFQGLAQKTELVHEGETYELL